MLRKFRIILFVGCMVALLPVNAAKKIHNVLVLQSYAETDLWSQKINAGIKKGFLESSMQVNITTEYLNSRSRDPETLEKEVLNICRQATERGTDLIIVSNDEAYTYLMRCKDLLPKSVPVVFLRIRFYDEKVRREFPNSTGLISPPEYKELLDVAAKIFPDRKNVILLYENGEFEQKGRELFNRYWSERIKEQPEYTLKEFNIMSDPLTTIISDIQLSETAQNSIVFVPYWGLYMPSLTKVSRAPTFTVFSSSLTQGGFGAITSNPYKDGLLAAKIAAKILSGTAPSAIPVRVSESEMTFDNKQLIFFNVPHKRIPSPGIITNQVFIEEYGIYLIAVFLIIVLLLGYAIIWLFKVNQRESRRRMHAQTRLLVQERIVEQRNEFDNIFHSIQDSVVTYDNDLRIHFVNKKTLQMVGIDLVDDVKNRSFEGRMSGELGKFYHNGEEILEQLLKRVAKTGKGIDIPENTYVKLVISDEYFPVSGEIVPIYSKGARTGLALTFRNISKQALQKRFFDLAIEENSIYPWQYNIELDCFVFSSKYMEKMGFNSDSVNMPRREASEHIHPEDWEMLHKEFNRAIREKSQSVRLSFRQRNSVGIYEWWEVRFMVLEGIVAKTACNVLGICQSIQQHKDAEKELILARDKALQADKVKTAFLANITHEIRTPLNSIVGFSELLKEYRSYEEEEVKHFITTINKNCSLLLALINDVLDMSKVESGSMDFQIAPYDLSVIMQDIYDSQKLNAHVDVELIREVPDTPRVMNTDPVRLKQVLNNLINNAMKFTAKGSITFGYIEEDSGSVMFFVRDTGKGMSKEEQRRIFERFYKIDNYTQGAGLGLSICQTIVERLKGKIWVESLKGIGTTFCFRLPDNAQ